MKKHLVYALCICLTLVSIMSAMQMTPTTTQPTLSPQERALMLFRMRGALLVQNVAQGNVTTAKALLAAIGNNPAVVNHRDAAGKTALQYATEKGLDDLAQALRDAGAE